MNDAHLFVLTVIDQQGEESKVYIHPTGNDPRSRVVEIGDGIWYLDRVEGSHRNYVLRWVGKTLKRGKPRGETDEWENIGRPDVLRRAGGHPGGTGGGHADAGHQRKRSSRRTPSRNNR